MRDLVLAKVIERAARLLDTRVRLLAPSTEGWRPTYVAQIAGSPGRRVDACAATAHGLRRTAAIDAALSAYHPV
ncbi:MAG: hypothetical protein ACRDG6_02795, partial [Candidatus Limnocylindria bacterium]